MIQIDMQMPKNCLECPACNEYLLCAIPVNGRKWGENDVREFGQGRPEWCPMKEQEKKEIKLHKKHVITWKRDDEFTMRKLYEAVCETLLDEGELFIAQPDEQKADFVFYVAEGR